VFWNKIVCASLKCNTGILQSVSHLFWLNQKAIYINFKNVLLHEQRIIINLILICHTWNIWIG